MEVRTLIPFDEDVLEVFELQDTTVMANRPRRKKLDFMDAPFNLRFFKFNTGSRDHNVSSVTHARAALPQVRFLDESIREVTEGK